MANNLSFESRLDYVHCLFQELQEQGIDLPMGDYNLIFEYLEDVREYFINKETAQ